MLVDNAIFKGKLVKAHTEPCLRATEENGIHRVDSERFNFVVDESSTALATVTDKYTLVQNAEFVSALDIAAEREGLKLEPISAEYTNGRSFYKLQAPELAMQVGNDPSKSTPMVLLQNDYRGQGGLKISTGIFRLVCTNGLVVGTIASKDTRRHVGDINVLEFVQPVVERMVARFEAERIIAETLAGEAFLVWPNEWAQDRKHAQANVRRAKEVGQTPDLLDSILADTADRYHADVHRAMRENGHAIGHNLWAVVQAVSEVATHRMQARQDGTARDSYNATADDWATRQLNNVLEFAGVK